MIITQGSLSRASIFDVESETTLFEPFFLTDLLSPIPLAPGGTRVVERLLLIDGVATGCFADLADRLDIDLCGSLGLTEEELVLVVAVVLEGVDDDKEIVERGNFT
ncbi:hypothetical protein V2J09_007995 [Rumex salicifolius]